MDRFTGAAIGERADIVQAIADILTTPIGTRVERRDYGSMIFELVDTPASPTGRLRVIAATADALERWEDRIRMGAGVVTVNEHGTAVISLSLTLLSDGSPLDIDVPFAAGGLA